MRRFCQVASRSDYTAYYCRLHAATRITLHVVWKSDDVAWSRNGDLIEMSPEQQLYTQEARANIEMRKLETSFHIEFHLQEMK
jgi:hypothetical protein